MRFHLDGHWETRGSFAPFRHLAKQLREQGYPEDGYESLFDTLLMSESSRGKLFPPIDDPCVLTRSYTTRIADGIAQLLLKLYERDCQLSIQAGETLDEWSLYVIDTLFRFDFPASFIEIRFGNKTSMMGFQDIHQLKPTLILCERLGFSWDVINLYLRNPDLEAQDPLLYHRYLGSACLATSRYEEGVSHFQYVIDHAAPVDSVRARTGMFATLMRLRRLEAGRNVLDGLKEVVPLLSGNKKAKGESWVYNLESWFAREAGNPHHALALTDTAIEIAMDNDLPSYAGVYLKNKALLLNAIYHTDDAPGKLEVLEAGVQTRPFDTERQCELGQLYLLHDRIEDARACFEAAYEPGTPTTDAMLGLAQCDARSGHYSSALNRLKHLIRLRPTRDAIALEMGRVKLALGDTHEAIEHLLHAWELQPENHQAAMELMHAALSHNILPDFAQIEAVIGRMKSPLPVNTHMLLAALWLEGGYHQEAYEDLCILHSDDSDLQGPLQFYLATAALRIGEHERALKACNECLRLTDESPEAVALKQEIERHIRSLGATV